MPKGYCVSLCQRSIKLKAANLLPYYLLKGKLHQRLAYYIFINAILSVIQYSFYNDILSWSIFFSFYFVQNSVCTFYHHLLWALSTPESILSQDFQYFLPYLD